MPKKRGRQRQAANFVYSESDSEYDDEIQTHHKQRDKILLDSGRHQDLDDTEEEEVYGLDDSDSDDEEIADMQQQLHQLERNKVKKTLGSDLEDDSEDEALPDSRAWGNKKSWFMGGDVRDNKIILSGSEDEAGAAALEEKEMQEIQKRRRMHLTEEDYLPPSLMMQLEEMEKKNKNKKEKKQQKKESSQVSDAGEKGESDEAKGKKKKKKKDEKKTKSAVETGIEEMEKIHINTDFSKLPEEVQIQRIMDMHPEYMPLCNDLGAKMRELQERITPLMGLVMTDKIDEMGATYVRMKYHIVCNYLICGGFYIYLMAKRTPRMHNHPVMKRLLELQQFYDRLVPLDNRLKDDMDRLLEELRQGKDVGKVTFTVPGQETSSVETSTKKKARKAKQESGPATKKRKKQVSQETGFEEEEKMEDEDEEKQFEEVQDDNEGMQGPRVITYEMEKNKGLTAYRRKDLRNPRIKHRKKYRRALIRQKGMVQKYKEPKGPYRGEMTGIRAGIIRSRKLT